MEKHLKIPTDAGDIEVTLHEAGGRTAGAVALPAVMGDPQQDNSLDTLVSMILAHACNGMDVESPSYVSGINAALSAIENQEEYASEDDPHDMPESLQLRQVLALEGIVEALHVLTGTRVSRQLSLAAGIAASAVIADAQAAKG